MTNSTDLTQFISMIRNTMEHHPDIIFIKDLDYKYVYVNRAYRNLGEKNVDVIGKSASEIFEPGRAELFRITDREVITGQKILQYEDQVETQQGIFYALVVKSPIFNSDGDVIGIYGTGRDITALTEVRDQVETIINTIPYPMLIKDLNMRYIRVNDAYAEELGMTKEKILGKSDLELFGPEASEFYRSKDIQVLESGDRVIYLSAGARAKNENGEEWGGKRFMTIKDPLYDASGEIVGVVGIVNPYLDVSELQNDILNQQKIESLSALAGGIAHDLNNMLTSILGLSSILVHDIVNPEHQRMIKTIYNSSRSAASLIEKLLTFSKQTKKEFGDIDLPLVISNVIDLVSSSFSTEITINADYCAESLIIRADKTQISQMIMNLIINAVEAMNHHGQIDIVMQCLELDPDPSDFLIIAEEASAGNYVSVSITDYGHGIDKNLLTRIFDPFFTTKDYGSGLGLSIVYGTLTSHNGLLKMNTSPSGTTFEIFLPIDQSSI